MSDGPKGGVVAVLDQVRPQDEPVPGEDFEQMDLLGLREVQIEAPRRTGGRPVGARNRRTSEWAGFILARYASPLEVLAQTAVAGVEELATRLGCSRLEALQEKRHAATALLPYLHQRMPIAVDVTNHKVVNLTIVDLPPEDEDADLAMQIVGVVEDQGVSEGADEAV